MSPLSDSEKWKILAESDLTQAASAINEESQAKAAEIAEDLGVAYMAEVVAQLGTDAAADLLRNLPQDFRHKVIPNLSAEKASDVNEILSYPAETAGALIAKEYLSIPQESTIGQAIHYLQSLDKGKKGKVSYIYVVDSDSRIVGVMQVRDLIFYASDKPVREIMKGPVVQVETMMPQNDVAKLFEKHRYLGLPVVDKAQKLVGIINADSVLQVLQDKATDTIAKLVGTQAEELKTKSIFTILRLRLPWLFVNIASGLACAFISGVFEQSLPTITTLLLFVPVVLGLSESIGVQGATIVVRNLTLGHAGFKDIKALFIREIFVGVFIGIICGTVVGLAAFYWKANHVLGWALGASLIFAIINSGLIGLSLPLLFRKFKIDPAIASGPLVLAICDLQTLLVYFNVSNWILTRWS